MAFFSLLIISYFLSHPRPLRMFHPRPLEMRKEPSALGQEGSLKRKPQPHATASPRLQKEQRQLWMSSVNSSWWLDQSQGQTKNYRTFQWNNWSHILRKTKENWMINRGPNFLAVVWFGSTPDSSPTPLRALPSVSWTGDIQKDWETKKRGNLLRGEKGREGGGREAES